jgi:hypothetical protein
VSVRVVLNVSGANPELRDELEKTPVRHRAERIRSLATLGLMVARGGIGSVSTRSECVSREDEVVDRGEDDQQGREDSSNQLVATFVQDLNGF